MSGTSTKRYFFIREGRQVGPLTKAKLRELAITPETRVWDDEAFDRLAAGGMEELKDVVAHPVQPPFPLGC